MTIPNYNYQLNSNDCIHVALPAFINAKTQLFKAPADLDTTAIICEFGNYEVSLDEKSGIAVINIVASAFGSPKTLNTVVPVLQAVNPELYIGYGTLLRQTLGMAADAVGEKHWFGHTEELEKIDALIHQLLKKHNEVYAEPINHQGIADNAQVKLMDYTRLATLPISFGYKQLPIELTIGVHDEKLTGTFTVWNGWSSDENNDQIENFRFELPSKLEDFTQKTFEQCLSKSACADAITLIWEEDFGEDAELSDFFDAVLNQLNPVIPFLNGIKMLYPN